MSREVRRRILWIGDAERDEFAPAMQAAGRWCDVDVVRTVDDALRHDGDDFACCVIAESAPGEHAVVGLDRLRRRLPGAPIVNLTGTWCEGERRSGTPLRSSLRVPWHAAATTLDVELERLADERCPAWGYGETLTDEERFSQPEEESAEFDDVSIAVFSRDPQLQSWLEDASAGLGLSVDGERPRIVLCDLPSGRSLQEAAAVETAARFPDARRIALLNYPRRDDLLRCRQWGFAALLAKPLSLETLHACLIGSSASKRD